MNSDVLQKMVRKILLRKGNMYAKKLLMGECADGGEKKQQKIENWVQIELAKELQVQLPGQIVAIEEGNTDIVIKPSSNDRNNDVGIELKIQGTKQSLCNDAKKLKNFISSKVGARGFLIVVLLLKTKDKKHKSWEKAFLSLEPLKAITGMLEFGEPENIEPSGKKKITKILRIYCGEAKAV